MSVFITTGSSNSISETTKVSVNIRIAKEDGSKINFGQKSQITISNITKLLKAGVQNTVKYKDNMATAKINFNRNKNETYYISPGSKDIAYFEIEINGELNEAFSTDTPLGITIKQNDNTEQTIDFKVVKTVKPIEIKSFSVSANIIQKNKQKLDLCFEFEGNPEKVTVFENGKVVDDNAVKKVRLENVLNGKEPGMYEYTVQAIKGDQMVSKSETVLYIDESKIVDRKPPTDCTIINFCAAQNGEYLFALVATKMNKIELHYTNQIDGANWQEIQISDIEKIKPFVNSPMVHLQSDQEIADGKLGKILLIGGSRLGKTSENSQTGNKVVRVDIYQKSCQIDKIDNLEPRWGHTCVVFPYQSNRNTIWMLGGVDKYGIVVNKIWTSTDGIAWTKEDKVLPHPTVMHSACLSYTTNREKEAIYVGGGFKNFGEKFSSQIFKYENENWNEIIDYKQEKEIKAFGLGYGGIEDDGDTGVYSIAIDGNLHIKMVNKNKIGTFELVEKNHTSPIGSYNQGVFVTAFFKECVWFMRVNSLGSEGYSYSDMFYRIPTLHSTTINLYKTK